MARKWPTSGPPAHQWPSGGLVAPWGSPAHTRRAPAGSQWPQAAPRWLSAGFRWLLAPAGSCCGSCS
eukprot:12045620-Alexandrium_andersonii.AAC.1